MADGGADRTEKPTPKKKREGVKNGQVARSPDLAAWTTVLILTYLLPATVSSLHEQLAAYLRGLPDLTSSPDMAQVLSSTAAAATAAGVAMLPLMGVLVIGALAAGVAQGGARPYFSRAKPKGSRISPGQGFKRLFSPHSANARRMALAMASCPRGAKAITDGPAPEIASAAAPA